MLSIGSSPAPLFTLAALLATLLLAVLPAAVSAAPAAAASSAHDAHPATLAADGDPATAWRPAPGEAAPTLSLDLGGDHDIRSVRLAWLDPAAVRRFALETSSDGLHWYALREERPASPDDAAGLAIDETHRRHLRVRLLEVDPARPVGIADLSVEAAPSPPLPPVPTGPATLGQPRPVIQPLPAQVAGVEQPVRSLNGTWQYARTPPAGFWRRDAAADGWTDVPVPSNLAVLDIDLVHADGGWLPKRNREIALRRVVSVPPEFAEQRILVRFDAAFGFARVWADGRLVRTHRGSFTPFYADLTDVVTPGQDVTLTVGLTAEVDFVEYTHARGFVGDVSLVALPPDHLARVQVETDFDERFEDATLRVHAAGIFHASDDAEVRLSLFDRDGVAVPLPPATLRLARGAPDASIDLPIAGPRHWTAEHPYLYTLRADLFTAGQFRQRVERRVGFREIELRGPDLLVNGKPVKLAGVNWHQGSPHVGIAARHESDLESLRLLKQANVNFLRASHWPQFQYVLDAADELGFYVEQENSVMFVGWPERGHTLRDPRWKPMFMDQYAEMVELSYSHPSVVMYSTGNESAWGPNTAATHRYSRAIDPSRPTIFSWGHQAPRDGYEIFSHHYPAHTETLERGGQPVLFDEWVHVYVDTARADFDPAFLDFYGRSIRHFWDRVYSVPAMGGAIWHARDKVYFTPQGAIWTAFNAHWGLLDTFNRPKPEWWNVKKAYSPVRIDASALPLPRSTERLEVPVQNRFAHTSLRELEWVVTVNDQPIEIAPPDVAPRSSGVIAMPRRDWSLGDRVALRAYKTELDGTRWLVDAFDLTLGAARPVFDHRETPPPTLERNDGIVTVRGDRFAWRFDERAARLLDASFDGKTLLVGGPHLNLGFNADAKGAAYPDPAAWTGDQFEARRDRDAVRVNIAGRYGPDLPVRFTLAIRGDGVVETTIALDRSPPSYEAVGVAFDASADVDRVQWLRDTIWSHYPDDHVGRPRGSAHRHATTRPVFGQTPTTHWSHDATDFAIHPIDDTGARGTRDFRTSRTDYRFFSALLAGSNLAVRLESDGTGSARARVNPDGTVRLEANTLWSHPGFTGWGGNTYRKTITVPPGYVGRTTLRLTDQPAPREASVPLDRVEAARVTTLETEHASLSPAFDPGTGFYRIAVPASERSARLKLALAGQSAQVRVNGQRVGAADAARGIAIRPEPQTLEIAIVDPQHPAIERRLTVLVTPTDDLALLRPARASSALGHHPTRFGVDGDDQTRWCTSDTGQRSSPACDEWLRVDLGKERTIGRWRVVHSEGPNNTRDFALETAPAADGPWTAVDTVVGNEQDVTDRRLEQPVQTRWVRLRITRKSSDQADWPAVRISSFEVYER